MVWSWVILIALTKMPLPATTDALPVTVVPVTVVPVMAAGVDPPITEPLIVEAPEMATPAIVPPVMATLLAFWLAIVPRPLMSPEEIASQEGAAESDPVPVWFRNFLVVVVLPDSFAKALVEPEYRMSPTA